MKKITSLCATLMLTVFGLHLNAQINTYPYVEDFETGAVGWSAIGGTWALGTPANTVINSASSGTNAWVTNLTGNYNNFEISQVESPIFDLSGTTNPEVHLKIWWESENSWDGAVLQSSIDGGTSWQNIGAFGDPNNWYNDNTINGSPGGSSEGWTGRNGTSPTTGGSNGWVTASHPIVALNTQASVTFRVAFGSDGSVNDEGFAFDDFSIYDISCPQPLALGDSNLTSSSADLFWSEAGVAAAWEIELDTVGFTATGSATYAGLLDSNVTASGLLANTTYQYYVRAICGAGDSSLWAGPYSFTTLCSTYQAPYYESFEANGLECWSISTTTNPTSFSQYNWQQNSGTTGSGNTGPNGASSGAEYVYTEASNGTSGDSTRLESPIIDLTSIVNSQLKFDYHMYGAEIDTLYIQVNDGTGFVTIDSITGAQQSASADDWLTKVIDLTAYDGSTAFQVAFVVKSVGCCGGDISIDEIRINETCAMPTAGTAADLSSSSANLSWLTSGTSASTWSIEYGPTGFVQGTGNIVNGTTFNPHPLAGLIDGTTYDFYIISNCALGDKSPWAGPFNFTTFITGVDENTAKNGVNIFPNPNNGVFSLEVKASDASVKVMNTQGQIILSKNILKNNAKIDLSNNAKGIYFVTVTSQNGVSTHKVSVQ